MNNKYSAWKSPEGLKKIAKMYASGMSYESIAKEIGCHRKTVKEWMTTLPNTATMKKEAEEARLKAVEPLEDAAWKVAQGFEYHEKTYRVNKDGELELFEDKVKYAAPQPVMLQFLLKNKKPEEYKDKQEVQTDSTVTIRFDGGSDGADWEEISG